MVSKYLIILKQTVEAPAGDESDVGKEGEEEDYYRKANDARRRMQLPLPPPCPPPPLVAHQQQQEEGERRRPPPPPPPPPSPNPAPDSQQQYSTPEDTDDKSEGSGGLVSFGPVTELSSDPLMIQVDDFLSAMPIRSLESSPPS